MARLGVAPHVVEKVLPEDLYDARKLNKNFLVNPTGRFVIGGPMGDAGLTGCTDFGYVSCTDKCQIDHTHCVTAAFGPANGALQMSNGGPAVTVLDLFH